MKLFSDLLKAHIPVYLLQLVSLFSVCFSTQLELNVTHGTFKTLKFQYCIITTKDEHNYIVFVRSNPQFLPLPCLCPFICAVLEVEFPLKTQSGIC